MELTINKEIIQIADSFLGQEEIKGNLGFKDAEFERRMSAVGWEKTHAWCAYFTELVWKLAYQNWDALMFTRLDKLFSGSAVITFNNFQKTKDFICIDNPVEGALAVWQKYNNGKKHWTGHIAIVKSFDRKRNELITIDGNTNDAGGREGYIVAEKTRKLTTPLKQTGLNLIGFIHPKEIE